MSRPVPRGVLRAVALLVCLLLSAALPGCSRGEQISPQSGPATTLDRVTVSGTVGSKPRLTVPSPFSVTATSRRVLVTGTGGPVNAGQRVTVDYVGVNGADGREFDSTYDKGRQPPSFILDPKQYLPGLVKAIIGSRVGSRLLVAVPPADGYGVQGQPSAGIGPTDTLVVVVDVKVARDVLSRAKGKAVAAKDGLPTVSLADNGRPTITLPGGSPPLSLVAQPLIVGAGATVTRGQQITVHYTGVVWPSGRQFDSTWAKGTPASFVIGQGRVLAGWDEGLVGRTVGSQVLLVIPPDKGYGAAGKPESGIRGTDTLVFVVDLLDAV